MEEVGGSNPPRSTTSFNTVVAGLFLSYICSHSPKRIPPTTSPIPMALILVFFCHVSRVPIAGIGISINCLSSSTIVIAANTKKTNSMTEEILKASS